MPGSGSGCRRWIRSMALSGGVLALVLTGATAAAAQPPGSDIVSGYLACGPGQQVTIISQGVGERMFVQWGPPTNAPYDEQREYFLGVTFDQVYSTSTGFRSAKWFVRVIGMSALGGPDVIFTDNKCTPA